MSSLGFNPLVIGSIFQTIIDAKALESYKVNGFNPLVIGSIFQTADMRDSIKDMREFMFQSPSNRVNIPNRMP